MTRDEKIEWAEKATIKELLNQYERCAERYINGAEYIKMFPRFTKDDLKEDLEICRQEVIWRMTAGKEVKR